MDGAWRSRGMDKAMALMDGETRVFSFANASIGNRWAGHEDRISRCHPAPSTNTHVELQSLAVPRSTARILLAFSIPEAGAGCKREFRGWGHAAGRDQAR